MKKPKAPKVAAKAKPRFHHRLSHSYVCYSEDEDELFRFTVAAQLARDGDYRVNSEDAIEVLETAKGGFILYDVSDSRTYRVYATLEALRAALYLKLASHRIIFAALGGSLDDAIPEV